MIISHDSESNSWYIYLHNKIEKGKAVKQHICEEKSSKSPMIILDYDKNDKLLGIEIIE